MTPTKFEPETFKEGDRVTKPNIKYDGTVTSAPRVHTYHPGGDLVEVYVQWDEGGWNGWYTVRELRSA